MKEIISAVLVILGSAFAGLFLILLFGFLFSLPLYWLWNGCLVDAIDGVNEITLLQAFGILILSNLLFKSSTTPSSKEKSGD